MQKFLELDEAQSLAIIKTIVGLGRMLDMNVVAEGLRDALDPKMADKVIQQMQTQVQKTPFSFLQRAESENLLTFIQDEHPQTIALILLIGTIFERVEFFVDIDVIRIHDFDDRYVKIAAKSNVRLFQPKS